MPNILRAGFTLTPRLPREASPSMPAGANSHSRTQP